jgi:hypothetical protein
MTASYRYAAISAAVVLGLVAVFEAPDLVTRWRADQTARRLSRALHQVDSRALATLSASGSAQNLLCARRYWPKVFWSYQGGAPEVLRARHYGKDFQYRALGDTVSGGRATFEFLIRSSQPDKVASYTAPPGAQVAIALSLLPAHVSGLTRACSRRAGWARRSARAAPSDGGAKEA